MVISGTPLLLTNQTVPRTSLQWSVLPAQDIEFSWPSFLSSVAPSFSGKPLSLYCTAQFGFEKDFKPVIRWYSKDSDGKELEISGTEERR